MNTETDTRSATAFAAEFPATEGEWRKAAEAALKGRPLDPLLRRRTIDDIGFDAIAARREPQPIVGRTPGARWTAMTRIDLADPEAANAQAIEDLNNGASGLSLVLAQPQGSEGVVADTLARLERTLDGVMLDLAPLHIDIPAFECRTTVALVAALVENRGQNPADVTVLFGLDLLRDLSRVGAFSLPWPQMQKRATITVKSLLDRGFVAPVLMMDQRTLHDAGASEAQELAGALASALQHVRSMSGNGLDAAAVADAMSFAFACDADQFMTIAKLRAARLLWAAVRRELGLADKAIHIHTETSRRMMTGYEPQTNIVRATIAAFAAGVGGADSVTVLPYTSALGGSTADARRIARNAQAIIIEETNAYRVADPAAGAGAIENLTDALAENAWELFREIEREGGMVASLTGGKLQQRVRDIRSKRAAGVATRRAPIVGVSEFPKAGEAAAAAEDERRPDPAPRGVPLPQLSEDTTPEFDAIVAAFLDGASVADVHAAWKANPSMSAEPLGLHRLSEPFEHIRRDNEASPGKPVFLAFVGPLARHAARAGFTRNLLCAGGLGLAEGPLDGDAGAIAEAFAASGAALAVVCGADRDYADLGEATVAALVAHGATVWLAGRPADGRDALEKAGVARFVAAGDDAIQILAAASAAGGAQRTAPGEAA